MTNDISERLRLAAELIDPAVGQLPPRLFNEGADKIDALAARLAEAERLLFALRDGIAVADFGDWNLLDQVDSFRSGDSTASSASGVQK